MMLAQLLASMKDDNGRVLVEHFYDGIEPLSATEKRALADAPDIDAELMQEFWLGATGTRRKTDRADHAAIAEHSRHGQFARLAPGVECDSRLRHRDHRHASGERHGSAADRSRLIDHIRKQGFFIVDQRTEPRRCGWRTRRWRK